MDKKPIIEDWGTRFNRELDKNISDYRKGELHFEGDIFVLDYMERTRPLLKDRPQCVGFDDLNVMNMMYENDSVVIIDFERYNICDPWEEFSDIAWSVIRYSRHFAIGQIRGYFDGEPPEKFWELITLGLSKNVLQWFDNMKNPVPKWYYK